MTSRRRFSERETIETCIRQGAEIRCYRTSTRFTLDNVGEIEREHLLERALGGADKPENCAYSLKDAHHIVTNGVPATSAGSSKNRIAKDKRKAKFVVLHKEIGLTDRPLVGLHDHASLATEPGNRGTAGKPKVKRAWPSRPMQSRPFEKRRAP